MPVTVTLEAAHTGAHEEPAYFVMIKGIPYTGNGLVITNAARMPLAGEIKEAVEEALKLYKGPKPPKKPRAPKNRFERL